MPLTLTSTAYSATPRVIHAGVNSVSFDYTSPSGAGNSFSASANASVILGPKIPSGCTIIAITGSHSSGADTCPVDIGMQLASSASLFATQKAQATHTLCTATTNNYPYKVSQSDDTAVQYQTVTFAATPGTTTAVVRFQYTVWYTRDP